VMYLLGRNNMIAINTIQELKQHCDESPYNEFFMRLNGGCRSTKRIQYYKEEDAWYITHEIDDSEDSYGSTEEFVENEPMIVKAIDNNAFFKEEV
jgi:hypothetical protein